MLLFCFCVFFFKQKTAYEMRISDWSSDVCSSDLVAMEVEVVVGEVREHGDGEAGAAHAAEGEGVRRHLHRHGLAARRDLSREEGLELGRLRGGARTAEGADDRGGPAVVLEHGGQRSEGRQVGKECGSTSRSRGSP